MELVVSIMFFIFAFICFIYALIEERLEKSNDDEQDRSDHLVLLLLVFAFVFFCIAGACIFSTSMSYYSSIQDALITEYLTEYHPLGWFGIIMGVFCALLVIVKVAQSIGEGEDIG